MRIWRATRYSIASLNDHNRWALRYLPTAITLPPTFELDHPFLPLLFCRTILTDGASQLLHF
jgi:hypothetical protein